VLQECAGFGKDVIAMSPNLDVRWGWIKGMYIYTILGAGGYGLGIIFVPDAIQSLLGAPRQDPVVLGVTGSVYLSFALLSILGLRSPLKFVPVLLLQLTYKTIWFVGVIIPILIAGKLPTYAILLAVIWATYIIGDMIAIPFGYVFRKEAKQ
jgi:hypothetical protein